MHKSNKEKILTRELISKLEKVVPGRCITKDPELLEIYSKDKNKVISSIPGAILFPENTKEVSQIMKLASKYKVPITPRGGGTSVTGSAVPMNNSIILSLEKMDTIIEVDKDNLMAVIEPGVINIDLQNELKKQDLFYPPDPASLKTCTIGGNVALCAGGMRAVKYGVTKDYILGLEVVLPSGEIVNYGGKLRKNVTGYDLMHLFIGSEGTLGIITKIILKVLPKPLHKIDLWIPFSNHEDALTILHTIYESRFIPSVIEFLEKDCIKAWEKYENKEHPYSDAQAHIIVELDGNDINVLNNEANTIKELASKNSAIDTLIASKEDEQEELWEIRRVISEAMTFVADKKVSHDIVVPPAKIREFINKLKDIKLETGFDLVGYGHLGDGNVHVNILKNRLSEKKWQTDLNKVTSRIFDLTLELGGTISGEHGIGYTKRDYLKKVIGDRNYQLMSDIKKTFDPLGILNPQKIFI